MISRGTFQPQLLWDFVKHMEVLHLFGGLKASVFLKIFKLFIFGNEVRNMTPNWENGGNGHTY